MHYEKIDGNKLIFGVATKYVSPFTFHPFFCSE